MQKYAIFCEGIDGHDFVLGREWWKERVFQPVIADRIGVWKEQLTPKQVEQVTAICAPIMKRYQYNEDGEQRRSPFLLAMLDPASQWGRIRFSLARRRQLWWIGRLSASRGGFNRPTMVPAVATAGTDGGD